MEHATDIIDHALQEGVDLATLTKALCEKATQLKTPEIIAETVKTTFAEHGLGATGKIKKKRRVYWTSKNLVKKAKASTPTRLPSPPPDNPTQANPSDDTFSDTFSTLSADDYQAIDNSIERDTPEQTPELQTPELCVDKLRAVDINEVDMDADLTRPAGHSRPAETPPPGSPVHSSSFVSPIPAKTPNRVTEESVDLGYTEEKLPIRDAWDDETLVDRFWNNSKSLPVVKLPDNLNANTWLVQNLDNESLLSNGFYATYETADNMEPVISVGQSAARMMDGERSMKNLAAVLTYHSFIRVWEQCARENIRKPVNSYEVRRARDEKLAEYQYFNFSSERVFNNCAKTGLRLVSFLEYICQYKDDKLLAAAKKFFNYIPTKMIFEDGGEQNWAAYVMEWTSYKIDNPKPYKTIKPQYHFKVASRA